jgi:RNA polymerase sigma-70 factor (ECF subfamily)
MIFETTAGPSLEKPQGAIPPRRVEDGETGMPERDSSDESLIKALPHDPELLQEIYRRWGGRLASMMRQAGVPAAEVADVLQVVLTEIWQHAGRFDPTRGSAANWLFQIARRRTIDHLRREARRPHVPAPKVSGDDHTVERLVVEEALESLGERERRVLILAYYYGYTQREIAELWHVPLGTVKSWAHRALLRVRQQVGDWPEEGR